MKSALALLPSIALDTLLSGVLRLAVGSALALRRLAAWWSRSMGVRATVAAMLAMLLSLISVLTIDLPVADNFREIDPEFEAWAELVTQLGDSAGYIIGGVVLAILFWWIERANPQLGARWRASLWAQRTAYFGAAVIVSGVLSILLKNVFGRPRPRMWFGEDQISEFRFFVVDTSSDFASYPSGHATTIWTVAFALILIFGRRGWVMLPVAIIVSVTRVVLTDHYVGDIIAGAVLGGLTALALAPVFRIGTDRNET